MTPAESLKSPLFTEKTQRSVLYLGIAVVALWVSIDVADSTILKPDLLAGFSFLLVALWLGRTLVRGTLLWHQSSGDILIALFLLTLLVAWGASPYRLFGTSALLLSLGSAICFFAGTQLFDRKEHVGQVIDFLAVLSFLICIVALVQFFGADHLGIRFNLGPAKRVMSTLGNATYLAGFLAMMIPLVVARIMSGGSTSRNRLLGGLLALMVVVLFLTQARSGIVAMIISVAFLFTIVKGLRTRLIFAGIITITAAAGLTLLFLPDLAERLSTLISPTRDFSFARRIPFWSAGWDAVVSSPLLGHGPGSVPFVIASFRRADYWVQGSEDIVPHVHNEILEVTLESGVIGMILYSSLFAIVLWRGFRSPEGKRERVLGLGITAAIIAILLDNMTNISLRHAPVAMIAWLLAGITLSPVFQGGQVFEKQIPFNGRIAAWLPFAVWLAFAFFQGREAVARVESDRALQRGRVAVEAGKQSIAANHFHQALAENPSNLIASFELCVSQLKTGRYKESLETAKDIRAAVPDYPKIGLLESLAWLQLDSLDQAEDAINRELKRRDHPEAYYTQSLIHARLDDTVGVRQSLEKVLERNIAAYSRIHLESTCRTLLGIALTREDLERLGSLLGQLVAQPHQDAVVTETLAEVRKRLEQQITP